MVLKGRPSWGDFFFWKALHSYFNTCSPHLFKSPCVLKQLKIKMSSPKSNPVDHLWANTVCINTASLCSPPCRENMPKCPWPLTNTMIWNTVCQSLFYRCLCLGYYRPRYYLQILVILEQQLVRVRGERGGNAMFVPFLPSLLTSHWEFWVCEGWFLVCTMSWGTVSEVLLKVRF